MNGEGKLKKNRHDDDDDNNNNNNNNNNPISQQPIKCQRLSTEC